MYLGDFAGVGAQDVQAHHAQVLGLEAHELGAGDAFGLRG